MALRPSREDASSRATKNTQNFMELKGSLPCLSELSIRPYLKSVHSSPYHPILPLQDPSEYYSPTYILSS
jgi:hypothetical protein